MFFPVWRWCPFCMKLVTPLRYKAIRGELVPWQPSFSRHICLGKLVKGSSYKLTRLVRGELPQPME